MSELFVKLDAFENLFASLEAAATEIGRWGGSVPRMPTTGAGAAQATAISSHLLEQIAHVCLALESASEALRETMDAYAAADARSAGRGTGFLAAL